MRPICLRPDVAYFLIFAPTAWARFKERAALSKDGSWERWLFPQRDTLAITLKDAAATDKLIRDHLEDEDRKQSRSLGRLDSARNATTTRE